MVKIITAIILASMALVGVEVRAADEVAPARPLSRQHCTVGSAAERAYCRALEFARTESRRTGSIEERLSCLERKLERHAAEIEGLNRRIREFTTPGIRPLGMADE